MTSLINYLAIIAVVPTLTSALYVLQEFQAGAIVFSAAVHIPQFLCGCLVQSIPSPANFYAGCGPCLTKEV